MANWIWATGRQGPSGVKMDMKISNTLHFQDFHAKAQTRDTVKTPSLRGTSQDRSSAHSSGPGSSLPPLARLSPAFMGEPPLGRTLSRPRLSQPADLSVLELPQLVAKVGPQVAIGESLWMEGPCLMASALGADIPLNITEHPQEAKSTSTGDNVPVEKRAESGGMKTEIESKTKRGPLTGFEVFEILAKKRHLGELRFYHLKESESAFYRPYDLHVVSRDKAGSDHYIFSSTSVVHVQDGCSTGLLTLAEWYREAMLWKALRDIPFFRDYQLRKTFRQWKRNVSLIMFKAKRQLLQSQLLIAVPQFREALIHFTRLLEELKKGQWLPQDETRTYTLLQFQNALLKRNKESRGVLQEFLRFRSLILAMVQENSYKAHQKLQHQVEQAQLNQCTQPMHLQQASMSALNKELNQAEQVLQRLGDFAALMDCMIVQTFVTITHCEIMTFHNKILKREQEQQGGLFQSELTFGADGQLALFPPMHLFQEVLLGAVLSVSDSGLQVFGSCSKSPCSKDSLIGSFPNTGFQDLSSSASHVCNMSDSISRASKDRGTVLKSGDSFSSMKETTTLVIPKLTSLRVQGQRMQGQYYPLFRKQLEWHLDLHAGTQEIEKEQARIAQEAHKEIQQLCEKHSWLVDAHLFTSQWSKSSLESMRGWPAPKYKEHIQKVHSWIDRVCAMPPAFTTSNKLLTVTCSHVRETLGPFLITIEEDSLNLLSEEFQLCSENLTSELNTAAERLRPEPKDFSDFTNYALMVRHYKEMSFNMQQQLDNLCFLQKIIQLNSRNKTPLEVASMQQTLDLWNQFVPLLKKATDTVTQQLPSMTNTLDSTFSLLTKELENLVRRGTTGPYVDPNQGTDQMITELNIMCGHVNVIVAQLNEMSRSSQSLRGHPLDLTFAFKAQRNIEARKGLWELMAASTAQIQAWKLILFSKFVVSRAQEKITEWLQQSDFLARVIPPHDAVLRETLNNLQRFNQQLSVLAMLSSSTLKYKHWKSIFKSMGLLCAAEHDLTVGELMSKGLLEHQSEISKVYKEARTAADMEHEFQRLQQSWERAVFRFSKFIVTVWQNTPNAPQQQSRDSGTFTIIGLEMLLSQTEDSIMTLSTMLASPHAVEFRKEAEHWVQLLQKLEELLDLCERYQQKWVFLTKILCETSFSRQKVELLGKFHPVDEAFREMIQLTLSDPHVLNFVQLRKTTERSIQFQGENLHILFTEGLTVMEEISSQLLHHLDSLRDEFPRLCFLSDREVINLLLPILTHSSLLSLVRKCFRGVRWLEIDNSDEHDMTDLSSVNTQMWVRGVYGTLREHMSFLCPLEPNLNALVWLRLLEKKLQQTVKQLMLKCTVARLGVMPQQDDHEVNKKAGVTPSLDHACISSTLGKDVGKPSNVTEPPAFLQLISEYPLQCLLVAEEVLWCCEIEKAFLSPAQTKWVQIKSHNATKLESLCQAIRDIGENSNDHSLASKHTVTALRALVLLTMKHSQHVTELTKVKSGTESFEWQRQMKYRYSALDNCSQSCGSQEDPNCTEHSVCVDVLGTQLAYGYEYIGPENWMMVNTSSTDRAFLGILLALTSYRCAFIDGPNMSGKKQTILQLGWAQGQQVITLDCCASTSSLIVHQMLIGALQTGAWIVLDSVDSMEQGTLSVLGQHLMDIHQCLATHQRKSQDKAPEFKKHNYFTTKQRQRDSEMECKMQFGSKNILAELSFGCVIISSNGYSAEVPENLRVASRPVSLLQPDYSIIAEVLLISLGFRDATGISQRLVSLFNLAKDSLCLPDFVSRYQCSWLALLRKVIHASGTHLYNDFGKSDEDTFLVWNGHRPGDLSLKGSDKIQQEIKDHHSSLYKSTSRPSVVNSVKEEQAVIKAVMLVLLPAITENMRASQFHTIFEEIFPTARSFPMYQQFIEENEQNLLTSAVIEEMQQTGLCADTQMLHNAVSLHQTLQFSKAVVLVGPAGSGKTTLYQVLAGALRQLAIKSMEEVNTKPSSTSCWCSVHTVVLFPNAFPREELFGKFCEQPGPWCDGPFTKVIRDTERNKKKIETQKVKWLVLDGEPLSQPGWFDSLSTLGDHRDPFLYLASGEKVQPSNGKLKVIVETTSLTDATPSALAQCGLVYVSGKDLWKTIWKAEMDSLYRDHSRDESTLKMWSYLAEDLFSRTLVALRQNVLTTVMASDGHKVSKSSPGITEGLQEVTSFIKILHALLGVSGKGCVLKQTEKIDAELLARNLFVVAYIWGFGGHLHPRHWSQFDHLARVALFESRYKIEVPVEGTVFDHFFCPRDGKLVDTTNTISFTKKSPTLFYSTVPQYQKHACLLDHLLESRLPALIVGEAGAGKTMLCKSLSQERSHLHFPVTPLLHSAQLHYILKNMGSQRNQLDSSGTIKFHPGLLLFLDDLHDAPFDNKGKASMPLETLRQCISKGGVQTSDSDHFQLFSSGAINYLGTCSTFETNSCSQISPRLSRLFTILALPSMTADTLFSIHSTLLQPWLKSFPCMPQIVDMASCVVTATFDVYLAVQDYLHSSAHSPHIVFSLHDLQKVFIGMCLWNPRTAACELLQRKLNPCFQSTASSALPVFSPASFGPAANVLNITRLWMHECLRTFGDRLSLDEEIQKLVLILTQVSEKIFGNMLLTESQTSEAEKSIPSCHLVEINTDHLNQHQHSTPSQKDNDWSITSRFLCSMANVTEGHLKQSEKSESSEEQSSSESSSSRSDSDDDFSVASSSRGSENEKGSPKTDEFLSESTPSTTTCTPQTLLQTPPKGTKPFQNSGNEMSHRMTLQYEVNHCDISKCEEHQASYKLLQQLLLQMGPSARNVVYSPDLSEALKCTAQQHNSVYQERDLDILVQQMAHIIKRKEKEDSRKFANFAVYRKRVCQLVHIIRALLIPGGHGVLFGATKKTGRKTTVHFATYLMGYQLIEVHRGNEGKLKEMLRKARSQIDVHGGHVVFLIHEDISQVIRDKLLVLMANGTDPGLYTDEELQDMIPKISATKRNSHRHIRYFRKEQRNLHMFLLLPLNQGTDERQIGPSSVTVPRITKVLRICCCVEVYQPWSSETLAEVAFDHLNHSLQIPETDVLADQTLVASLVQVMAEIHQSAMKYATTFLNIQPFSPQTFYELMTYFCHLCGHLREQSRGPANRVATVLARMKEMTDSVQKYSQEVFRLKVKFEETQKSLNQLQRAVDTERTHCEQARLHCLLEEGRLSLLEEQLELAEQQARDALNEVSPLYQAAHKTLQSLNQSDLDEVRHYRIPPEGVVMLMNAICMLFSRPCNWESCKQLLGQSSFLQELEFFDCSKLTNEMFQKLGQIVQESNLQPHLVRNVSRACESLSCWLQALYEYACVQRRMAPQEARKNRLNKRMAESRTRLCVARLQEDSAQDMLEDMERQQQLVRNDLEELAAQLHKAEAQEKEASAAVKQVSYYTEKWKSNEKEIEMNNQTTAGDALIMAAAIAYLGPFGPDIRQDLLEKWHNVCLRGNVNICSEDSQRSLFRGLQSNSFQDSPIAPIPVSLELHNALSRAVELDDRPTEVVPTLVLKLLLWAHGLPWAHQWALLANTEQHEDLSSQTIQLEDQVPGGVGRSQKAEYELVVSADDPEFLDKLRHGAEKGLKVLITHTENALPSEEFLNMLVRPAGSHSLGVFHPFKAPHSEFCLFLSTHLPVQLLLDEVHPLILEKVKIIDLSLSTSEVQDIILNNLLQSTCLEVWVQHCQLNKDKQALQDKLQKEEASLMTYILQSFTPLSEDPGFCPHVSLCQSTSLRLQADIEDLSCEIDGHKPLINEFHHIAVLATALYEALQEVGRLSPFYFFPLHDFLVVLREAFVLNDQTTAESVTGEVLSEISHRIVPHILAQYRPFLLQSHADVLRLLVSVAYFVHNEGCSETEHMAFLRGISNIESLEDAPASEEPASELPSWIPLHVQGDICLLEKIPPFHGLVSSLRNSSRQWHEYFRFPSSTVVGLVPCPSHSHLRTLQRALLWKTIFPQWFAAVADDLASCQQGQPVCPAVAGGPHTGSPEALSHFLSKNKRPVIVTLPSQNEDESGSIHPLYWIKQVAQYQADKKGVKVTVISFGSACQRDVVLLALDAAIKTGQWLVLNNCHLLDHWDIEVVAQLKQLISYTSEGGCTAWKGQLAGLETNRLVGKVGRCSGNCVHPHFRLWFITKANAPLSVPAVVRICAMHLACDSHWDLQDELRSSLKQVISTTLDATSPRHTVNLVQPLTRCAILHSVLLQRQRLKHLGQGSIYNLTQDDLLALVNVQVHIAKQCSDPTGALEYIAAHLIYGGHVSDSADLQTVAAACRVCLQPALPTWGSGPHILSEIIMGRYFDEEDLLKSLERCVQITKNSSDSVVLGFGAGLMSEIVKVKSHRLNLLLLQSQSRFSAVRGASNLNQLQTLPDYKKAQDRLQVLQDKLGYREESRGMGVETASLGPLRSFLQTEWDSLIEVVGSLLEGILQPSRDLNASSYVTSSTISKLEIRADLLRTYQTEDSPPVYCLSAFANPRGFLAALTRETLIKKRDVSCSSLHFQVLGAATSSASVPSSGICISGLELHGALWDTRLGVLQDTLSSKPCPLPLLWVTAQERNTDHPPSNSSCSMPVYNCPLYVHSRSTDENWSLSEENIVTHVPLKTKLDPVLCPLRRVRLVSILISKYN